MMSSKHHWCGVLPDVDDYFGFVYIITHQDSGRKYIGKKQYWRSSGKVKRRPSDRQSDKWRDHHWLPAAWQKYTGSSKELNKDIKKNGKRFYTFEILKNCRSKGDLHYSEIVEQILMDVLRSKLPCGEYEYYNKQIAATRFRPPNFHSDETRKKIKDGIAKNGHPMQGKVHPNKGKKLPQCAPKDCAARGSKHITNGVDNLWLREGDTLPVDWGYGITRTCGSRAGKLTDLELEARKFATGKAKEASNRRMADKTGFDSYEDLVMYIVSSKEGTRASLASELQIGWTTVDRILKKNKDLVGLALSGGLLERLWRLK